MKPSSFEKFLVDIVQETEQFFEDRRQSYWKKRRRKQDLPMSRTRGPRSLPTPDKADLRQAGKCSVLCAHAFYRDQLRDDRDRIDGFSVEEEMNGFSLLRRPNRGIGVLRVILFTICGAA